MKSHTQRWLIPVCVASIIFLTFFASLHNNFINWDDERNLTANFFFRGLGLSQLRWMFSTFLGGPYMPLTWISFGVDYKFWGMDPFGYHLTNLLLHSLNGVLFYFLALNLLSLTDPERAKNHPDPLRLCAAAAALLFAVHPLRVESVAWATERKDVLSGFFYLLTLECYLQYAEDQMEPKKNPWPWFLAAVVFYSAALLAKASTMTLPVVLLLLDFYPLRRNGGLRVWLEKVPFFLLAVPAAWLAAHGQVVAGLAADIQHLQLDQRLGLAAYGALFYIGKMLIPVRLIALYSAPPRIGLDQPLFFLSVLLMAGVSSLLYAYRKRWSGCAVVWFYYLIVLSPMSGVFQSGSQIAADRYTYLSMMGWPLLAGGALFQQWTRPVQTPAVRITRVVWMFISVSLIVVLAGLTKKQVRRWRDAETLWSYVLTEDPRNAFAAYNLGDVYQKQNKPDAAYLFLQRALDLKPDAAIYYKLGVLAQSQGQLDQAANDYRQALAMKPTHVDAVNSLASALSKQGKSQQTLEVYTQALQIMPGVSVIHNNLGAYYLDHNQVNEALEQFQLAVNLDPENETFHNNLEVAHGQQERLTSIDKFQKLLMEHPDDYAALNRLGVLYLSSGDYRQAELYFRRALRHKPNSAADNNNLGVALMALGRQDEGIKYLDRAVQLDPDSDQFRRNRDAALHEKQKKILPGLSNS